MGRFFKTVYFADYCLRKGVELCWQEGDHGTREMIEHILVSEEEHVDWLEAQLDQIAHIGIENYLAQQIRE